MTLDSQGYGKAPTGVDHAGVLPGAHEHVRAFGRQPFEVDTAGLVGAMFAPHHCVHGELEMIRLAAEKPHNGLGLLICEAERCVDIGSLAEMGHPGDISWHIESLVPGPSVAI
jgi:hypothetical protein